MQLLTMLRGQPWPTRKDQFPVKTLQVVLVLLRRPSGACSALVFFVTSSDGVADSEVLCPDIHYIPVLLCSSGMPWDFKSWASCFFCSHSSSFSTHPFFFIFPSLNQLLPPDFSFSEMGLPHILNLCLSTSFCSSLSLAFGSSMLKMPFRLHSCNSAALAL